MSIQAVVFDIGGVLEYIPDLGVRGIWEQKLHLQEGELNKKLAEVWYAGSVGTITLDDVHVQVGGILGINESEVQAFMDDIWEEYVGIPNTELIDYCRELRANYRVAILSNSFVGAREREEARYQFSQLSEFIIYSHEVGMMKPDPRIYALTCERLELSPQEVIFIDDVQKNIDSACEFGIHGIVFENNQQVVLDIESIIQANS